MLSAKNGSRVFISLPNVKVLLHLPEGAASTAG
jgi:hypothetical protein